MTALPLHGEAEGTGPLVVLLHPIGLDNSFWGPLPAALAAAGRRVLRLDTAGHGRSPAVARPRPIEAYADDVAAAIAREGEAPAALLGLSFGGMIAQMVAVRHPQRVAALALCGCGGGFDTGPRPMLQERGLAAERGGMVPVLEATIERWFTEPFRGDPAVARVRERLLADDVAGWSAGWHAIAGFDARPHHHAIAVPTLVIGGERDVATPPAAAQALAGGIPGARLVLLPGAPHMMQVETPEAFTAAAAGFLAARP